MNRPIERHFLGWDAPALPRAAAWLAARHIDGDALRLDRCTVVVPGARAGRRLKELLVAEAAARAVRLVPPRVTTVGHLPELLYTTERPVADPALARRVWARVLRALPADRLALLFVARPADADVRGWSALAREVERLHGEIGGDGLRFEDVAERCGAGLLFDDADRWRVLADVQSAYEAGLAALGREDRERARRAAAAAPGGVAVDGELCVVGVLELPAIVRRLVGAVGAQVLVHAPADRSAAFDAFGCVRPEAWRAVELPIADAQLSVCDRPADQAAAALDVIARLDGRYAADEIVVAVPDTEVSPFLEQRFEAAAVPTRSAAGTPIERTRPYRLLEAVAAHLEAGDATAFAALVRHPDLGRWIARGARRSDRGGALLREADGWLGPLDAYLAEHLPARVAGDLAAVAGEDRDEARRNVVSALRRLLEPGALLRAGGMADVRSARRNGGPGTAATARGGAPDRHPLAVWAPAALELLLAVYGDQPVDRARPAERRLLEACRVLRDAAAGLYRLPAEVDEPCDGASALRLILDEAKGQAIAPEPDHAAVELLGTLELYLDDAPVAIVTGANEPFLPRSVNADAFLPNALRARLGLLDNDRRHARDACQLAALLHARAVVHITAGRRSAQGDPLVPSRLLLAASGEALAQRAARFFGARPQVGSAAAPERMDAAEEESGFRSPPEPVLSAPAPIDRLSVTRFRALLRDPFVFALERVLRLEAVDDAAHELDPSAFGNLAHAVLERFGASADAASADAGDVVGRLDALLDARVAEQFGAGARNTRPAVRLQVEQLRARLHAFARWHAARVGDGWRVVAVEAMTPPDGVPFPVDGEPFTLTGRIDRIEHHAATGAWALFDYKTGDAGDTPEKTHCRGKGPAREWTDLQLPLYRHILPHVRPDGDAARPPIYTGGDVDAVMLGYITLCADLDAVSACVAEWTPADLAGADDAARDAVRLLRRNVFAFDAAKASRAPAELAAVIGSATLKAIEDEEAAEEALFASLEVLA